MAAKSRIEDEYRGSPGGRHIWVVRSEASRYPGLGRLPRHFRRGMELVHRRRVEGRRFLHKEPADTDSPYLAIPMARRMRYPRHKCSMNVVLLEHVFFPGIPRSSRIEWVGFSGLKQWRSLMSLAVCNWSMHNCTEQISWKHNKGEELRRFDCSAKHFKSTQFKFDHRENKPPLSICGVRCHPTFLGLIHTHLYPCVTPISSHLTSFM